MPIDGTALGRGDHRGAGGCHLQNYRSTTQHHQRLAHSERVRAAANSVCKLTFYKALTLAKVDFQFRDIRAKAATNTGDLAHSQKLQFTKIEA